ncbi:hypothetical protein LAZ67_15002072 [Cordylochernes scorpioides]|uniref:Transposable element Tc1 transposase n=1 Tax=Cordylochernes scorpioides TaxID=51811 RepID=A0ABY6LE38_9ARAC|nr:hypothetical protein LAZ67_15002072 [Cordylochernes scorpioides]
MLELWEQASSILNLNYSHPTEPIPRRCLWVLGDAITSGSLKVDIGEDKECLRGLRCLWNILTAATDRECWRRVPGELLRGSRGAARYDYSVPHARLYACWSTPAWPTFPPHSISGAGRLWSTSPLPVCSSFRRCSLAMWRKSLCGCPARPASSGAPGVESACLYRCGSSDLALVHRYWSCSAVRPLIREAFSINAGPVVLDLRDGEPLEPRHPPVSEACNFRHRKRRQFKQTDAFTRGMMIGLKRAARVDRRILRQAVAAPQATCTAILQHVQDTLDHSISTRTISRRLVANGLHSCRPLRRLPLTPPNRRQRLEWCRARSTWMTEWHRVVFSDESRFCLSSDSRRVRVWRRRGESSNPAAIVERPTVRQRGIMVWGAIAYDSRSPLLRIQGTMTAQRYVDDVLRPVTLPYLQGVPNALYQQDNARPHTARISQQALQDVQMLPWPPYSPDLSPIEHVWDIIGRRLRALPQPPSEDELWQMVEREWRAIPQDAIRTLIDSLPRRVAAWWSYLLLSRRRSRSVL